MKRIMLAVLLGTVVLAPAAHAATTHCDDHDSADVVKVEGRNNDFVPPAGMLFCVKASTQNTGQLTGDGTTSLIAFVEDAGIVNDNGEPHDVSYYVVYDGAEQGNENSQPAVSADDNKGDAGDDKADETTTSVTVESDVDVRELSAASGDAAAGTAGAATAAGVETPAEAEAAPAPTEPQTEVLGETLERGPSALARTGAGIGGLALLGGLLCGGGLLVRRFLGIG